MMDNPTQPSKIDIKETLLKFYSSRTAQIILDLVRIFMLIAVVYLIYYIWQNVEAVKFLNTDACAYCPIQQPGYTCMYWGRN